VAPKKEIFTERTLLFLCFSFAFPCFSFAFLLSFLLGPGAKQKVKKDIKQNKEKTKEKRSKSKGF